MTKKEGNKIKGLLYKGEPLNIPLSFEEIIKKAVNTPIKIARLIRNKDREGKQ